MSNAVVPPIGDTSRYSHWVCRGCSQWDWASQKKCSTCGMKKSYSDAVSPSAWQPSMSRQISQPQMVNQQGTSGPAAPMPTLEPPQHPQMLQQVDDGAQLRAELGAEIDEIDTVLASLPKSKLVEEMRLGLESKKEALKQKISGTRPISSQLSSCLAAVDRARKRHSVATDAVLAAQAAVEKAEKEAIATQEQLQIREAQLASLQEQVVECGTGSSHSQNDCLQGLENSMTKILCEMKSGGQTASQGIDQAFNLMNELFVHLSAVAKECKGDAASTLPSGAQTPVSDATAIGHHAKRSPSVSTELLAETVAIASRQDRYTQAMEEAEMVLGSP